MKAEKFYRATRVSNGRSVHLFFRLSATPDLELWNKPLEGSSIHYTAIVPVAPEADQALKLHDQADRQSLALLQQLVRMAERGHYTTELRDFLVGAVGYQYRDNQAMQRTQDRLRTLPPRDAGGPVESWMLCAAQMISRAVLTNNEGRRRTEALVDKLMDDAIQGLHACPPADR